MHPNRYSDSSSKLMFVHPSVYSYSHPSNTKFVPKLNEIKIILEPSQTTKELLAACPGAKIKQNHAAFSYSHREFVRFSPSVYTHIDVKMSFSVQILQLIRKSKKIMVSYSAGMRKISKRLNLEFWKNYFQYFLYLRCNKYYLEN